jgi:hypothetical protein
MNMMTYVPPIAADALDSVTALLKLIADAQGSKERLAALTRATTEAHAAVEAAATATAALTKAERSHREKLDRETAQHTADLASARSGFEKERTQGLALVSQREAEAVAAREQLNIEISVTRTLRADLERRMADEFPYVAPIVGSPGANVVAGVDLDSDQAREYRLSPQQAGEALAELKTRFQARERQAAAERTAEAERLGRIAAAAPKPDVGAAQARLDQLTSDPAWKAKFYNGSPEARATLAELTSIIAEGKTDLAIAGNLSLNHEIETVSGNQLTSHKLAVEIDALRQLGLSDPLIKQALDGQPVSASEKEMAKVAKRMRLEDAEWTKRYMANNYAERREMLLLNLILSSAVAA